MTLLIAILIPIIVATIAAAVALYGKRLDRRNETESRHSAARGDAYDRLIAAGDAAWLYRTKKAVDPEGVDNAVTARMGEAANELFQSGLDRLKAHSSNFDAQLPTLEYWYHVAFDDIHAGARSFENSRDAMLSLRRRETGLRKRLGQIQALSFYERLRMGNIVQRLPDGIDQVMRTTDGEIIIIGSGDQFMQDVLDATNHRGEVEESRKRARGRLAEWREKGVWKLPDSG